jgi:hypothetical protein
MKLYRSYAQVSPLAAFYPRNVTCYLEGGHVWGCHDAFHLMREAIEFLGHYGNLTSRKGEI